jgi:predicted RNA-binding Zn-ribbon protein involved in translation (DUF1610 family)
MVKVYVCPHCGDESKKRADCRKHLAEKHPKLKGSCIVIDKPKEVKKPKASKKTKTSHRKSRYKCPECSRSFKSHGAVKDHMSSKKHKGDPILLEDEKKKETKKEEPKKEEPKKEEPKEPEVITEYLCNIRIYPEVADVIRDQLTESLKITTNPNSGNYILSYLNIHRYLVDWLKFTNNFTEIEMENSDVIYCLNNYEPTSEFGIYDMAGLKQFGIKDVSDDGIMECDFDSNVIIENSVLMGRLIGAEQDDLACVGGIWKKVYTPPAKKTTPTPAKTNTVQKQLPKPVQEPPKSPKTQNAIQSFQDWELGDLAEGYGMDYFASEYYYQGSRWGGGQYSQRTTYTPPAPPEPKYHPVYRVIEGYIITDRIIDYEIFA